VPAQGCRDKPERGVLGGTRASGPASRCESVPPPLTGGPGGPASGPGGGGPRGQRGGRPGRGPACPSDTAIGRAAIGIATAEGPGKGGVLAPRRRSSWASPGCRYTGQVRQQGGELLPGLMWNGQGAHGGGRGKLGHHQGDDWAGARLRMWAVVQRGER